MLHSQQILAYLKRIQYHGDLSPSLTLLKNLQQQHLFHIPFENLDIHRGVRIELDTERIYQKLVVNRRGGFCFELNGLFYELLTSLGFRVKIVSAIVMDEDRTWTPEYDHMSLVVNIEGTDYLSDAGFGRFSFWPIKLAPTLVQEDQEGKFRVESGPAERLVIAKWDGADWQPEFAFHNQGVAYEAFAGRCAYHQDDPGSHFLKQRVITMPSEQGRLTLTDKEFKITRAGETFHAVAIKDEADFMAKLRENFGVEI
ncbi:MAG: arylamine N-acetyltransferase [Bacteroidota bacterium]